MDPSSQLKHARVYSVQVTGIRCTNCAGKIKTALHEGLHEPGAKVAVNIMQEKVTLTLFKESSLQRAIDILHGIGFPPVGQPVPIAGAEENERAIAFGVRDNELSRLLPDRLLGTLGVLKASATKAEGSLRVDVVYNCQMVKGHELAGIIAEADAGYSVINDRIDSFSRRKAAGEEEANIGLTIGLGAYFFVVNMILPVLPGHEQWYDKAIVFPGELGLYTLSVIVNILLTVFVMGYYGRGFIYRAWHNYTAYGTTNMETLIALGSSSAFGLFLFFLVRYSIEYYNSEVMDLMAAVMNINDTLTSSAIIVLVVTVGKYFEGKVKQKI